MMGKSGIGAAKLNFGFDFKKWNELIYLAL